MLITNGIEEKNVTKGAYRQFYEPLGYKPIVVIDTVFEEKTIVEPIEVSVEHESIEEKPIEEKQIKKEKQIVSKNKTPKKSKK